VLSDGLQNGVTWVTEDAVNAEPAYVTINIESIDAPSFVSKTAPSRTFTLRLDYSDSTVRMLAIIVESLCAPSSIALPPVAQDIEC